MAELRDSLPRSQGEEEWRHGERERERVWAARRWMDGGKVDVVSPGRESCLASARPEI